MALWEYGCTPCKVYVDVTTTQTYNNVKFGFECPECRGLMHMVSYDRDDRVSHIAQIRELTRRVELIEEAFAALFDAPSPLPKWTH